jgi:hypothetical protein
MFARSSQASGSLSRNCFVSKQVDTEFPALRLLLRHRFNVPSQSDLDSLEAPTSSSNFLNDVMTR